MSLREMENTFSQRRRTPSFSSSLLDAICRSFDEPNCREEEIFSQCRKTTVIKKQSIVNSVSTTRRDGFVEEDKEIFDLRRAIMIESWMEKQSTRGSVHCNSTSASSDSSSATGRNGGVFSPSEAESSVKDLTPQRNKPISEKQQKPKCEGGFTKTKLQALRIYGELKKVKQPISPGGRIASFLNSIFRSGTAKKAKMCSIGDMGDASYQRKSKSACSSVTSFSNSCFNKTPPSREKQSDGNKRSVRFYPVSVIVDEDSKPCGHKCIYEDDPGLMPMPVPKISRGSSVKQDAAKGGSYIRNYQKKNISEFDFRGFHSYVEDSNDDDSSCSSSDLFELDHLIGIGRYIEELPVYETTSLKTNQAIANGFSL
ncbi:protein BIG GRAIN 1-like A [Manihot esculenta]|uniref:Protein BIG GRAIN 1-like B n=1 Tax=Manihot esculenta TaxID=3983 RepID=A0A2C9W5T4_MANES|nr:protein BIG GRAIN 1-like A [Manihot esculenta]OAY53970.1 hypothetical protein MANES_03G038000v8 [Manihot esculenta]